MPLRKHKTQGMSQYILALIIIQFHPYIAALKIDCILRLYTSYLFSHVEFHL